MEYNQLLSMVSKLIEYDKEQIVEARTIVRESIKRSQKIREEI